MTQGRQPNRSNSKPGIARGKIIPLLCEIDDALGTARAFGRAMELMSLGLKDNDYGPALITMTESVLRHVEAAKEACVRFRSEIDE